MSTATRAARFVDLAKAHAASVAFGVALLPRLLFLFELRARSPTFAAPEGGDSILYDRLASGASAPAQAYFHSPLYIAFLTAFYRTIGRDLFALRLVQHVLGALACGLVAIVTRKAFHSRAAALVAGLLAASLGPPLFYEGQVGVDGLMPFLVMVCVVLALSAWRARGVLSFAAVGLALGVAALGRAVMLAWLPPLLFWGIASRPPQWRSCAALLAGVALSTLPATIHNWRTERVVVPITTSGGLNLYIGNNEAADGAYVLPQGLAFHPGDPKGDFEGRRAAEEGLGRPLTSREVSAWWSRRAWAFIRSEPRRTAWLVLEKVRLLASNVEYAQLHDYDVYREVAPVLGVLPTAGFVVIPGLAGLLTVCASWGRRPVARRLAALAWVFAASFLPFFVVGRYRVPWLLLLAPFAAWWGVLVITAARTRVWRALVVPVTFAVATAGLSTMAMAVPSPGFQYMEFARASLDRGDRAAAAHWCVRALARDDTRVDAAALLGRLRREDGQYPGAEEVLEAAVRKDPGASLAWYELALVRIDTGHLDEGIVALLASVDADPRSIDAWSALVSALRSAGREEEASAAERSVEKLRSPRAR